MRGVLVFGLEIENELVSARADTTYGKIIHFAVARVHGEYLLTMFFCLAQKNGQKAPAVKVGIAPPLPPTHQRLSYTYSKPPVCNLTAHKKHSIMIAED